MRLKESILYLPGIIGQDTNQVVVQKRIIVYTTILMSAAGVIWAILYFLFSEPYPAVIPISYSVFSLLNLLGLYIGKNYRSFRFIQLLLTLFLPVLLMISLGGFISGSAVVLWGLITPIGALLCCPFRQALYWFAGYVMLVIISGFVQPYIRLGNNLPDSFILSFFVVNIVVVSSVVFFLLNYFVGQKDKIIDLIRKNSELEHAYLKQEVILQQSEKLATLGKLSAGLAHELNNPASAAKRGAEQLRDILGKLQNAHFRLGEISLSELQIMIIENMNKLILEKSRKPVELDPLRRNDLEFEIEKILENSGIKNAWEHSPVIVNLGLTKEELTELISNFSNLEFPVIIDLLGSNHSALTLLEEINHGSTRISEIVKALKSYTYMDQAPVQSIDIHEGLDNTLVMLRSQLRMGINVIREYSPNLPRITAYGSELNQVWTNIIDNAITAMGGKGKLILRTYAKDQWLFVDIVDSGPGIPEDVQSKIFDPFFTTKAPGEGTGLGLNISYNVVTKKHHGDLSVYSKPGETCFRVKLPLNNNAVSHKQKEEKVYKDQ